MLPLGRVVNDAKVTDHHAIIPTRAERHPVDKMSDDDRRIYDLVVRRFLAVFHPDAVFENTRVETTVATHVFRTRGKLLLVAGWRGVYGETADIDDDGASDDDEGREQRLPRLEQGEQAVERPEVGSERKETKPPRRYTDASLLDMMETAGKLVDDEELREAMKDSGIGTPATRAAIIERLLQVGYIERDGRALVVTEKGLNVIRLLGEHALTSPGLTGEWEHRLSKIETGEDSRKAFMGDIVKFAESTVGELDTKLKDVRIPRANLGPCPVCARDIVENRKGYSCWARDDPGCGFVIWKSKAGKQLPVAVARELIKTGRTERPVTGFKGRSGKSFRAKLALMQTEEGKWRVEFDEAWAKDGAKPPEAAEAARGRAAEEPEGRRRVRRAAGAARPRSAPRRAVVGGARHHVGMPLKLVLGPANSAKAGEVLGAYASAARRGAPAGRPDRRRRRALHAGARDRRRGAGRLGAHVLRVGGRDRATRRATAAGGCRSLQRERVLAPGGRAAVQLRRRSDRAAQAPGFAAAAGNLIGELERSLVTPQRFAAGARARGPAQDARRSAYAEDVALDLPRLRPGARPDRAGSTPSCSRGGRSTRCALAPGRWGADPVFFYGFDDLHPLERDAVETLARIADASVTVSLTYEPGRAALGARAETVEELRPLCSEVLELPALDAHYEDGARPALHHLERSLFEPQPSPGRVDPGRAVRLLEAGGELAEAELAAATVLELRAAGVPGEEIAVVYRSPAAVVAVAIHERVFEQYGIAIARDRRVRFGHTTLGRGVLALSRCALLGDRAGADDLLDYLRAARACSSVPRSPTRSRPRCAGEACAPPHRRASGSAGRCGELDALRGAATRPPSSRDRRGGCWPRPHRGRGRRCSITPRSSTPARWRVLVRRARGARRARRASDGRRADRAARAELAGAIVRAPPAAARCCSPIRSRSARAGSGRCSCAGCARASSRRRARPSRSCPTSGASSWRLRRACGSRRGRTRSRASATCSTRAHRAPRGRSCSATAAPTRRATSRWRRRSSPTSPSCSCPSGVSGGAPACWPTSCGRRTRRRPRASSLRARPPRRAAAVFGEPASPLRALSSARRARARSPQRDPLGRGARGLRRLPGQVAGRA